MSHKKKRNIIIGTLCGVLLLMVVGYAAFNSVLKIKGTSNISSNWDIKITKITSSVLHGTPSNAVEPTGVGTLTATFETNLVSPGDSMQYVITITNNGSMNATLEKITVSKPNNDTITFETSGLTEGSTLTSKGTADLTVTVTYKDIAEGQKQPDNTKGTLSVTLDYVQEGSSGGSIEPTPTTHVVYRYTTDELKIGDSIEGVETVADPSILGKNHYLKHEIEDHKIVASYVCFVTDTEHCMQGGNAEYYEINKALLQSQESWFTNKEGGACEEDGTMYMCHGEYSETGYAYTVAASKDDINASDTVDNYCVIYKDSSSLCVAR